MDQIIGQIQAFGFNFTPRGWAFCDGQLLSIAQNTALFSLLGTTFGGNGTTTFSLPDLRGRTIVHPGAGLGLTPVVYGEVGGAQSTSILQNNMPMHVHALANGTGPGQAAVTTTVGTADNAGGNISDNGANSLGTGGSFPEIYSEGAATTDKIGSVTSSISGSTAMAGGSIPLDIRNPYLGIYTSIALVGMFPSRN
jgi:microcystin-dependent protein